MGMLATVMNSLALEAALERAGAPPAPCRRWRCRKCASSTRASGQQHLAEGPHRPLCRRDRQSILTTDTTAVLRAAEMGCDGVLKATNVDGVYSADPKRDPNAKRFEALTHQEAIARDLRVMDTTAFALARENHMPIIVFSIRDAGAVMAVLRGEGRATRVG